MLLSLLRFRSIVLCACVPLLMAAAASAQQFVNLGNGHPGVSGVPSLSAEGALQSGTPVNVQLRDAAPNSPVWFAAGLTTIYLPLFGGILVPYPEVVAHFTTDGQGKASFSFTCPDYEDALFAQCMVLDPASVRGFSFSNALSMIPSFNSYVSNKVIVQVANQLPILTVDVTGTQAQGHTVIISRGAAPNQTIILQPQTGETPLNPPTGQAFTIILGIALQVGDSVVVTGSTSGRRSSGPYNATLAL